MTSLFSFFLLQNKHDYNQWQNQDFNLGSRLKLELIKKIFIDINKNKWTTVN